MTANVMVVVERQFDYPRPDVFQAWTQPAEMARWRGSLGWHVEPDTVTSDLRLGGRHHHVKVRDNDPTARVTTDAVFTEFFDPDVFVARQRITGDPGIDPDVPLELRVEFSKTGRDGTLLRIIQGPFEPDVAGQHSRGWEQELDRLQTYLTEHEQRAPEVSR
ncbi:SRPBCC domain-containing protein [Geodermatophilus sp. TF02-6]|uniref:SRPBCC family protein n=1 Tax=Geodermatophilus sp. TF02-6 TaxID=2250575 RepID=UPI000DEA0AF5|nr:SRPBCC domain-containing protein [Geodermatophilus sp. TF02-6]RBY82496.1 SRPBCC domain-containing protein [Geodermatophilus sp. TF02-6]